MIKSNKTFVLTVEIHVDADEGSEAMEKLNQLMGVADMAEVCWWEWSFVSMREEQK